ncbi:unnamed protein product, partial [Amoebophrya sp. A25]|eukprot:GSA25T00012089001.1
MIKPSMLLREQKALSRCAVRLAQPVRAAAGVIGWAVLISLLTADIDIFKWINLHEWVLGPCHSPDME